MTTKPPFCQQCPINHVTKGYVGHHPASTPSSAVIVGESSGDDDVKLGEPFSGGAGSWLKILTKAAKKPIEHFHIIQSIGCHTPDNIHPTQPEWKATPKAAALQAVEYCNKHHLQPTLNSINPTEIITLGGPATKIVTGRSPISLWRGSVLPWLGHEELGTIVKPTLHPMAVAKQGHMASVVVRDLRRSTKLPPENYNLYPTLEDVAKFTATEFSFDFEWDRYGNITLCGLTDHMYYAMVVPFEGAYINLLKPIFERATAVIGQNIIGADLTHIAKLGWKLKPDLQLWDTMLMQHLTQPDHRHGLAFIGSVMTQKNFWKGSDTEEEDSGDSESINGSQWKTWDKTGALSIAHGGYGGCRSAEEAFRLYNARDTDGTYQAWQALKLELRRYDLEDVYWNVSIPAAKLCQKMSAAGLKIDQTKLKEIQDHIDKAIAELELKLPPELAPYDKPIMVNSPAPPNTYKEKIRKYKGLNYIFTRPNQTITTGDGKVLEAGKMQLVKIIKTPSTTRIRPYNSDQIVMDWVMAAGGKKVLHQKSKRPTADKSARQIWQQQFSKIDLAMANALGIVGELKRLSTSRQSFAKQGFTTINRVYYNILPHGTAEGRFASSGQRKGLDPNIQNQPKEIRKLFVPDSADDCFLSVDISQGENELTALLSKDTRRMQLLRSADYDEHSETASIALGFEVDKKTYDADGKPLRQIGKKINHMTNYGAGAKKVQEALTLEGFPFTIAAVKEMLVRLSLGRPQLTEWQRNVIAFVEANSFCANPFGRKRWFQDNRFAPKAMAFGPASTLADCVIRMMMCCYASQFQREIAALNLTVCGDLPEGWELRIQVHDELCFHGPKKSLPEAARLVAAVMTQPWKALDDFAFNIDMQASAVSWGNIKKYTIGETLTW